jgi:hypothetical protein
VTVTGEMNASGGTAGHHRGGGAIDVAGAAAIPGGSITFTVVAIPRSGRSDRTTTLVEDDGVLACCRVDCEM